MNKQKHYLPPGVAIYRIEMEAGVAQTVTSPMNSITIQGWDSDEIVGAASEGDGGDVWISY